MVCSKHSFWKKSEKKSKHNRPSPPDISKLQKGNVKNMRTRKLVLPPRDENGHFIPDERYRGRVEWFYEKEEK